MNDIKRFNLFHIIMASVMIIGYIYVLDYTCAQQTEEKNINGQKVAVMRTPLLNIEFTNPVE